MISNCKIYKMYVAVLYVTLIGIVGYSFFNRKEVYKPLDIEAIKQYHNPEYQKIDASLDSIKTDIRQLRESIDKHIELTKRLNKLNDGE